VPVSRAVIRRVATLWLLAWAANSGAYGSVSLSGTRLIFDGNDREAGLQVTNRGAQDVLLQAVLSAPEDDDDTPPAQRRSLPFVVTPPLQRLAGGSRQTLRVIYQGEGMPDGRESLLHLYVTQVPQRKEGVSQLNIAVRQRINLFYRPPGIQGDPALTAETLRWELATSATGETRLQVSNPTPYHASLQALNLDNRLLSDYLLLAPGARQQWPVPTPALTQPLRFKALTDYGGQRDYCAIVTRGAASSARLREKPLLQEEC
jgi:P pilus assembly chaperone PapD